MTPLRGLRIVVTRAAHQAEELARLLREQGAEVLLSPVIEIAAPLDPTLLREAAAHCNRYHWLIFTSANAVQSFAAELLRPCTAKVATIGAATRAAAERLGFTVTLTPVAYRSESLAEALGRESLHGKRVLMPSAAITRDVVPPALRALGATVDVVVAYRNVIPACAAALTTRIFADPLPDWVTFASSSAVSNTVFLVGASKLQLVQIASIGSQTSATIREYGLPIAAEAERPSVTGLVEAICRTI